MTIQNKRLAAITLTAAALLAVPAVAMQFTSEVSWTASDFVVAGVLLFGTGGLIELALRTITKPRTRLLVCAGILIALLLVWAELAVGVFGTPFAGS